MRLDQWLFETQKTDSREKARQEILAGHVRHAKSGVILDKPGWKVPKDLDVILTEKSRFVGRAGEKLDGFLNDLEKSDSYSSIVAGEVCLDVGSSTGGFSDCLLQRGARQVFAVDVGTHQLHEKLRDREDLQLFEQTDIRHFYANSIPLEPRLVTVDVSFISLRKILPHLLQEFPRARYVLLFKPQFELGRHERRKKGGVVYESDAEDCLKDFLQFLESLGLTVLDCEKSKLKGGRGNQEFFILAQQAERIEEMGIHLKVFRTYDIRGNAEKDLSDDLFRRVGAALAKRIADEQKKSGAEVFRVGIGRDARESSPRLTAALIEGLKSEARIQIVSLGELSTPMVYFASHRYKLDAVFQVTASHNPKEDNGIKMMLGSNTLFGDEIQKLGEAAQDCDPSQLKIQSKWNDEDWAPRLRKDYLSFLHKQFQFGRKFRVAVDSANGMAGMIVRSALEPYCEALEIIHEEVDCQFPNHPADPTVPENMVPLQNLVRSGNFDLGLAYDGDGDRVGLVTPKGRIIWGDEILMLLSEKVLKELPGATIIGEVKCSQKLFSHIEKLGGQPVMYRTGHSLIKKQMKKLKAPIAGEMSGHMFFADRYFGFDDSIYASLRVLECLELLDGDLDSWIESFPESFTTPEMRVELEDQERENRIAAIQSHFEADPAVSLNLIDGVRATFLDGSWALVRSSNTQPVLVVRIEGSSEARLKEVKVLMSSLLGKELS